MAFCDFSVQEEGCPSGFHRTLSDERFPTPKCSLNPFLVSLVTFSDAKHPFIATKNNYACTAWEMFERHQPLLVLEEQTSKLSFVDS